jgi:hypothetical protein
VKTQTGSLADKKKPNPVRVETKKPQHRPQEVAAVNTLARHFAEESEAAKKYKTALRSYRFQRARTRGIIEVLNENSYVMAEYSERTGSVKWQRMVLASQREQIEKFLEDHYPRV